MSEIVAKGKAFLVGVQFVRQGASSQPPASVAQAFLQMQDDADCHKFKVAIPAEDAERFAKYLGGFEGDAAVADIEITFRVRTEEGT